MRIIRLLTILPSLVMIGFGLWHFAVPTLWGWEGGMRPDSGELWIAVRAVNVFFSLCLVLLGAANVLLVVRLPREPFAVGVLLTISTVLWATRVVLQLIAPQGLAIGVAGAMLAAFVATLASFALALWLHVRH